MSKKYKRQNNEIAGPAKAAGRVTKEDEVDITPILAPKVKPLPKVVFEGLGSYSVDLDGGKHVHVRFLKENGFRFSTDNVKLIEKMDEKGFQRVEK